MTNLKGRKARRRRGWAAGRRGKRHVTLSYLDSTEPSWTEESFAFICDVRPFPVKEMDDHSSSGDTGVHVISNQLLYNDDNSNDES